MKKHIGGLLLTIALLTPSAHADSITYHGRVTSTAAEPDLPYTHAQIGDPFTAVLSINTESDWSLSVTLNGQTMFNSQFYSDIIDFTASSITLGGEGQSWIVSALFFTDPTGLHSNIFNTNDFQPDRWQNIRLDLQSISSSGENINEVQGMVNSAVPEQGNAIILLGFSLVLLLSYKRYECR